MPQPKQTWLERAKDTYKFHREKLTSHDNWTITKTSKSLKRSLGSVAEDLLIARWVKTHEKDLERFDYAYEAIAFIRKKEKEIEKEEL